MFALTPPETNGNRFTEFRLLIVAFYQWRWNQTCPWDGSEARQLSQLLKSNPILDTAQFKRWLYNYGCSDDIKPGERPRKFLPRIHDYSIVPLDRFGRSQDAIIDNAQTQRLRRGFTNLEQARTDQPSLESSTPNLPTERTVRRRDRQLGAGLRPLHGGAD